MNLIEAPDPFLETMFARMSPGAHTLFTPRHIDEIRRAFGARTRARHAIDWRASIRLFRHSYYVVFLVGRERRSRSRLGMALPGVTLTTLALAVIAFLIIGTCL